jgi:hypothetical protein
MLDSILETVACDVQIRSGTVVVVAVDSAMEGDEECNCNEFV